MIIITYAKPSNKIRGINSFRELIVNSQYDDLSFAVLRDEATKSPPSLLETTRHFKKWSPDAEKTFFEKSSQLALDIKGIAEKARLSEDLIHAFTEVRFIFCDDGKSESYEYLQDDTKIFRWLADYIGKTATGVANSFSQQEDIPKSLKNMHWGANHFNPELQRIYKKYVGNFIRKFYPHIKDFPLPEINPDIIESLSSNLPEAGKKGEKEPLHQNEQPFKPPTTWPLELKLLGKFTLRNAVINKVTAAMKASGEKTENSHISIANSYIEYHLGMIKQEELKIRLDKSCPEDNPERNRVLSLVDKAIEQLLTQKRNAIASR